MSTSLKKMSTGGICFSASIIGGNDYLLTEILILLPVKSVVRFKSVSKHWWFLISCKSFTRLHFQNHARRPVETQHSFILGVTGRAQFFICHPKIKNLVRVSLPSPIRQQRFEYVKILQSLNGLLLLSLKFPENDRIDYVVFNPTTKQYRFIRLDRYQPQKFCLLSDPSKSEHYKLVMRTSDTPPFSVYDSAIHQWSHGWENPFEREAIGFKVCGASLQNLIIYAIRRGDTLPKLECIPEREACDNYMFDSNGHLTLLQLKPSLEEKRFCFRVVTDQWVICNKATLNFGSSAVELLGMIREERMEDSVFLFQEPGRLLIYRFSDNDQESELEVLVDYRSDYFYEEDRLQFEYAHPFIHTFASV